MGPTGRCNTTGKASVRQRIAKRAAVIAAAAGLFAPATASLADSHGGGVEGMMAKGLTMPEMDATKGRMLFAPKGCVVCHSVNGVRGPDAPALDAEYMDSPMNPFEFAARMGRGAAALVAMQEDELGSQIELTGDELASIIAFTHDADEQAKFSEEDIPENIREMMEEDE